MNYFEFYLYVISVVIMIATPGPVMILVASAGLKGGYRKALETIEFFHKSFFIQLHIVNSSN